MSKQKTPQQPLSHQRFRGMGKVEFLACLPEIQTMLEQGYSASMVYGTLKKDNKITIGYSQFWRLLTGNRPKKQPAFSTQPLAQKALTIAPVPKPVQQTLPVGSIAHDSNGSTIPNVRTSANKNFLPINFYAESESKEPK